MATITRTEAWLVDLQPKVKRTDAIQAFTSQETPFVRVIDADGRKGSATATPSAPAAARSWRCSSTTCCHS
jgi:hypothetical protein